MQIGTGKVLDGSSRGLNTASMPGERAQANTRIGNGTQRKTLLPEDLGTALPKKDSRQNGARYQASFKETTNRSVH